MEAYSDLIEKYLRGLCSEEEKDHIKHLKATDEIFAKELRLSSLAFAAISAGERERQRERLLKLNKEGGRVVAFYRKHKTTIFRIAAAVLVLMVIGYSLKPIFQNSFHKPQSSKELIAQHFPIDSSIMDHYIDRQVERGDSSQIDSILNDFQMAFDAENCEAIKEKAHQLSEIQSNHHSLLFISICYLKINEPDSALSVLGKMEKASLFADQILWYSAMAYLQKDDQNAAYDVLCELYQSHQRFKHEEIAGILKGLNVDKECE